MQSNVSNVLGLVFFFILSLDITDMQCACSHVFNHLINLWVHSAVGFLNKIHL